MKGILIFIYRSLVPTKWKTFLRDLRNISTIKNELTILKREFVGYKILEYFKDVDRDLYEEELSYIQKSGSASTYPYFRPDSEEIVSCGFDRRKRMVYVLHKEKKLYFPRRYSINEALEVYKNLVFKENILGYKFDGKWPHQYLTDEFNVKENDTVVDVGACEGLFLLEVIDRVKIGIVIEPKNEWRRALKATFESYNDKVILIDKLVSNNDTKTEITLNKCLKDYSGSLFLKLDVEGYESKVLEGASNILARDEDIRIACCTYHRHDDSSTFQVLFNEYGFQTESSDGYMLFAAYDKLKPPFFRKGIIRAQKKKII